MTAQTEDDLNRAPIGLQHGIAGGMCGDLLWGILHFRRA